MPFEIREIKLFWRDIPGFCRDIPGVPEKFEKKKFWVQFLAPRLEIARGRGSQLYLRFLCSVVMSSLRPQTRKHGGKVGEAQGGRGIHIDVRSQGAVREMVSKKSTKIHFLGPETTGWGGGGLPREGVVVEKFVPSLESLSSLGLERNSMHGGWSCFGERMFSL